MKRIVATGLGVLALAALIVVVWPAAQPLKGVETVAIEGTEGLPGEAVDGLEIALQDREIRIVAPDADPDAVVTLVEPESGSFDLRISSEGVEGRARLTLRVERADGRQALMDLHLRLENGNLTAELTQRRFWEVWK